MKKKNIIFFLVIITLVVIISVFGGIYGKSGKGFFKNTLGISNISNELNVKVYLDGSVLFKGKEYKKYGDTLSEKDKKIIVNAIDKLIEGVPKEDIVLDNYDEVISYGHIEIIANDNDYDMSWVFPTNTFKYDGKVYYLEDKDLLNDIYDIFSKNTDEIIIE